MRTRDEFPLGSSRLDDGLFLVAPVGVVGWRRDSLCNGRLREFTERLMVEVVEVQKT